MNLEPHGYRCPKCGSPSPSTPHFHPTCLVFERVEGHRHAHAVESVEGELIVCHGQPERGYWTPMPDA